MNIHQLSVTYQADQDRILVRVNTTAQEEMRMWLTRRLMHGLWPLLTKLRTEQVLKLEAAGTSLEKADDSLKKMLTDFRKEEFLQNADFATPYQESQVRLPLGDEPLLVTDVNVSPQPRGRVRLAFKEQVGGGAQPRSFQMEVEPQLMQGLMHLLEQTLAQSLWREAFGTPTTAGESAAAPEGLPARPRYLN